jgi:hypothetical protein
MTPRLALIIAAMVDAKLDADARVDVGSRGRMARTGARSSHGPIGRRQRGRP